MASIYLARSVDARGLERIVALKRMHDHLASDRRFVEMFLDEARVASQIHHPHVCGVLDFGEAEGGYFIAMEYLIGETFARIATAASDRPEVARSPRYEALVARMIVDACEGLHAVHEARDARGRPLGVVHRDVSPKNLFLTYDGCVKLVDFGIARARDQVHHTNTGELKGSFAYIAPEQIKSRDIDRRADVWSLGVIAWELLAGRRLFRAERAVKVIYAVLHDPVPLLSRERPALTDAYDGVVAKALARAPGDRYATARDFGRELARVAVERGGAAVTMAELSEWMDALFPGARADKLGVLEVASAAVPLGDAQSEDEVRTDATTKAVARPARRWSLGIAALALALAGAAGVMAIGPSLGARRTGRVTARPRSHAAAPPARSSSHAAPLEAAVAVVEAPRSEPEAPRARRHRPHARRAQASASRAPTTANADTGRLAVVVVPNGWGAVHIGDRSLGQTPLQTTLATGRYVVEVRPFGRGPVRRVPVRITKGGVARVAIDLSADRP